MRAHWDNSRLEQVRTKVLELKKSLRLAEKKLREARESLIGVPEDRLKTALGFRLRDRTRVISYIATDGFIFKPLHIASLGRYRWDSKTLLSEHSKSKHSQKTCSLRVKRSERSSSELVGDKSWCISQVQKDTESNDAPKCAVLRTPIKRLTSLVYAAKNKTHELQQRHKTVRAKILDLNDKLTKTRARMDGTENSIKELQERIESIAKRSKVLELNLNLRKQTQTRICLLEKRLDRAMQRALKSETKENELETRVLELEDSLEAYDMKIHRAQNVLYRMNEDDDDIPAIDSCTVTMVLRRVSLSRQSSSASFKGQIPLFFDSCGEDEELSD